jgi:hypothetical protein
MNVTVAERRLKIVMHNTWTSIGDPVIVQMALPQIDKTGNEIYQSAANICFNEFIMDN